ncbi:helix-turn-helix domain-containing protein [Arsenicibacter rosenii]|uniref:HTH araC/xylS-type domain-containing protein n=1 Tax=Arsenicibacter rosenii TaxID=1750698 RepID=A0A1S2VQF1_9BACT|nr:helix-turn-helix domain-containing protein [Arsenicibacter rosenii]OIN60445.1 hypothetical protein BLX24_06390 [Arsenicibacter rosenii]
MYNAESSFIDSLNKLIDERIDDPSFSIESICQNLGISRSQLYRILKEETNLSTTRYLRKRRLLKVKALLLDTDLRISEICDLTGFTSPQNLSTYFTEEFGIPPTEFRKIHQSDDTLPEIPVAAGMAPVAVIPALEPMPDIPVTNPVMPAKLRQRRLFIGGGVGFVFLTLLLLWIGLFFRPSDPVSLPGPALNTVAVLPFVNLGTDATNPACEGIMDELYASVTLMKHLKVIARSSSDQYRETKKSMWQIGDELQVAHLLKGSVLKTGDKLQVKLEIIGTRDDIREWEHVYQGDYHSFFALTDQMVRDVKAQLNGLTGSAVRDSAAVATGRGGRNQARTRNLAAYNLFLQGRQLLIGRSKDNLLRSLGYFDRAAALDSTFADAYAYKATAYMLLWVLNYAGAETTYEPAERAALTAIRLDAANSTAYGALGSLYHNSYQWKAADNAFRIGLQHSPNDAQLTYWYSLLLRSVGRLPEAVRLSQRAIELDPLYPVMLTGHVLNCVYVGDREKARAALRSGKDIFGNAFIYYLGEGYYYLDGAEYMKAIGSFNTLLRLNPAYRNYESAVYYCKARLGKQAEALAWLRQLPRGLPRADYDRAVVFAGLNQQDSCLYYLKKAADAGFYHRDMKVIGLFKPYRAHPAFKAILRQYQLY